MVMEKQKEQCNVLSAMTGNVIQKVKKIFNFVDTKNKEQLYIKSSMFEIMSDTKNNETSNFNVADKKDEG
jgi:hypothetical protein